MKKTTGFLLILLLFAFALAACGGDEEAAVDAPAGADEPEEVVSAGDPVRGEELYNQVCIACHGPGGEGVEGLGKPFTSSEFLETHSDEELLAFIKQGRPVSDPENTTGVDMPPKGGNPALTDQEILDIIAYLRTLQD